jgi:hypothetical protein
MLYDHVGVVFNILGERQLCIQHNTDQDLRAMHQPQANQFWPFAPEYAAAT